MDYPAAANGKRNVFWGTLQVCPDCGRCLCFACHPDGPCLDQRESASPAWRIQSVGELQVEKAG